VEKQEFYGQARRDLAGPLAGLTVVEATTTWAGPMAACVLADLGARVIKVEHPQGEVARVLPPFVPDSQLTVPNETVNRNKESLSLELHTEAGKAILLKLIEQTDVFIENFRPGTLASWGLGYADLRAVKADIVYVSISGYGQFGPLSPRVGYDPVAQNFSGWTSMNGEPDGGPLKAPTYLGDDLGGLHGALGALAALRHRDQTGEGQHVDVALTDSVLFQSNGLATAGALGVTPARLGNQFAIAAPVNAYDCEDGKVYAGVLLDSHWQTLAAELGCEELAHLRGPERIEQRTRVDGLLADYCRQHSVQHVVDRFGDLGLPATRINQAHELHQVPHIQARDMLIDTPVADGKTLPLVGPVAKFSRTPTTIRQSAPTLGQHNEAILADLGFSADEVQALRKGGVISG